MSEGPPCRVPLRNTSDNDERLAATFRRIEESMSVLPRMYQALANAPALLDGWLNYAWTLREEAESDRGLRELAILRVAQLTNSDYVWRSHYRLALDGGISEAQIGALSEWQASDAYDDRQRAVLAMTDQLTRDAAVTDEAWAPLAELFNDRENVEIVLTVAWYTCAARTGNALRLPLEQWHERIPALGDSG